MYCPFHLETRFNPLYFGIYINFMKYLFFLQIGKLFQNKNEEISSLSDSAENQLIIETTERYSSNSVQSKPKTSPTTQQTDTSVSTITTTYIETTTSSDEVPETTDISTTISTQSSTANKIECHLNYDGEEFVSLKDEYLRLECLSPNNLKYKHVGLNVYKCNSNGEFTLLNTTCLKENEQWLDRLQKDVKKKQNLF